nr:F-box/LRR-repeat protein 15 [Ipomoea batatas]
MRIWCCLCFGEEEEEEDRKGRKGMREDISGTASEEMENDEPQNFGLGFPWDGQLDAEMELWSQAAEDNAYRNDRLGRDMAFGNLQFEGTNGSLQGFHHLASSSSSGHSAMEVNLNLSLSEEPSSSTALKQDNSDSHNKRPKVHSFSLDWDSPFLDESRYACPVYDGGEESPSMFSALDDQRKDGSPKPEDLEVRMDLTDDLLHMVFSFLGHIDLCRAARVCKQWRTASTHEDFWRYLNFENRLITLVQFEDMCLRYPNATAVNVYGAGAQAIHSLAMKAIYSLRNLEALTLGRGQLGETFFQVLPECHMLKSLAINDATLGNGIQEIPIYHERLRRLQLVKCRVLRVSVSMPHAVLNCPLLRDLDIAACHKLSDAAIRSAATSCPLLESLDMSNCSCASDETLREISLTCVNLHVLDASYCPNISLESVRLTTLKVLKLHSCEGITSASMAAIAFSYTLEVLELDNCNLLTSVSLDLARLQNIRLVHCRKFADLNLRSDMLSSITISNCPLLQRINITSNSLKKLVLQKQECLTTLALQCPSLQEVDLTECECLTNSVCEVFSDDGGCPKLKSLVLDNCESLTAVGFSCTKLNALSLAGCRGLTSLELRCPYLEQVSLDGCDHLERAYFCPVGLRSLNLGICPKLSVLRIEAPQMTSLELKGCGVLSEASINCPLLTALDASFCSQLKDDCLSATTMLCRLIKSLVLMSCPSVGSDGLLSLRWLPDLTYLDLSYTFLVNLQPVYESCLHLKVLKLQACKYLSDTSLEPLYKENALPALSELDLSYGTLCQSAIEELLACCKHLTHVSLNGCINMHDLDWGGNEISYMTTTFPSTLGDIHFQNEQPNRMLQNLTCVGCPNIKKVVIPMAQCFLLSSLNLSLSANLKEVNVACSNLSSLNLSNCCSLEILKLDCPRLNNLFLQSCNIDEEAVEAAISQCSVLETLDVRFCPKICPPSIGKLRAACPGLKRIFSSLAPA